MELIFGGLGENTHSSVVYTVGALYLGEPIRIRKLTPSPEAQTQRPSYGINPNPLTSPPLSPEAAGMT